jgi:hypothetical protein
MIDQPAIAIGPYPGENKKRFLIGCRLLAVIDMRRVLWAHETTARGVYYRPDGLDMYKYSHKSQSRYGTYKRQ